MANGRGVLRGEWDGIAIDYFPEELMVWFRGDPGAGPSEFEHLIREFEDEYRAQSVIGPLPTGMCVFRLEMQEADAPDSLAVAIELEAQRIDPDSSGLAAHIKRLHPATEMRWASWPNDPDIGLQWAIQQIGLPNAWSRTVGDPDIVIGIVDSGIPIDASGTLTHPELDDANRFTFGRAQAINALGFTWPTYSDWTTFPGADTYPNDTVGHGTMVTGIAAGESDNNFLLAGVNWASEVYVTKVDQRSWWVAPAVEELSAWARDTGRKLIINISIVGCGNTLYEACKAATQNGAIVVAAAGNTGECGLCGDVCEPAKYATLPEMNGALLAVGATELEHIENQPPREVVASWSIGGTHTTVVAPGGEIVGLTPSGSGTYTDSGTSYAAPLVTGVLSLIWSADPSLSNTEVVQILKDTAWLPPGVTAPDPQWGYGRIDAGAAVAQANPLMLAIEKWLHETEWRRALWLARMADWVIPKLGPQVGVIEYQPADRSRIEGWSEEVPS